MEGHWFIKDQFLRVLATFAPLQSKLQLIIAGTQIGKITRTPSISRPPEDLRSGSVPLGLSKIGRDPVLNLMPCKLLTPASAVSFLEIFYGYSSHSALACNDLTIFHILKACQKCMGHVSFGMVYQVLLCYLGFPQRLLQRGGVYLVVFVEQVARADELKLPLQIVSDFLCLAIWSLSSRAHTQFLGALEPPISAKWLFQQVTLRT